MTTNCYQYNENNVMHFSFSLLRIKSLKMFRALLAHPQEAFHKRRLVYCVRVTSVDWQFYCNRGTAKGAHTRTSLTCESASGSLTREPGSDVFYHTRMSGFRLVSLHTRTSLTHWNPSPAVLASQTRTCMGAFSNLTRMQYTKCRLFSVS
jgi:hypothetical protein